MPRRPGDDTFLYTARDLRSTAYADVFVPYGARAQAAGSIGVDSSGILVGWLSHNLGSVARIDLRGPGGWHRPCTSNILGSLDMVGVPVASACHLYELTGSEAAGPGTYTIDVTSAGAGFASTAEVLLAGASVRLPAPRA